MSHDDLGEAEVRSWFEKYSNWGRWGEDDTLGTLNHVTPAKRRAALASVRHGIPVSCSWDVSTDNGGLAEVAPQRYMVDTGLSLADGGPAGKRTRDGSVAFASEFISMVFHGLSITHLDALSHVFWEGKMYGGLSSEYVTDGGGATRLDVRDAAAGIQTRGVLLDVARARGVEALAPSEPIFPADLEAAEELQGVRVEAGDALLVRTGEGSKRVRGGWNPYASGISGLHAACIPWLHSRSVAVLGGDVTQDVLPSGIPGVALPIHSIGIVAMGLWIIDNCRLDELADACRSHGSWDFLFSVLPVRLTGVTGSPVNPIALL